MAKKNSALPLTLLIAVVILGGLGYYIYSQRALDGASGDVASDITASLASEQALSPIEEDTDNITEQDASADNASDMTEQLADSEEVADDSGTVAATTQNETVAIDVEAALSERGIGNPDAPIVIKEFASLTCGHCGDFHRGAYQELKSTYIDSGDVYLQMIDFPLNGPAVHGAMVARCLPEARYSGFMQLLFENQDKWAYESDYINYLRQNAALAGLGSEAFDACINNEELREGIMEARAEAQETYNINSTPSFVVNEATTFSGARNFVYFKDIIEAELAKMEE